MDWLVNLLDNLAEFLTKKIDFLELGDYSPGIYIAVFGVAALLIAYIIASIVKSRSEVKNQTLKFEDAAAFVNTAGPIDEEKVGGVFSKVQSMPRYVVKGWDAFMVQQTAYPSDYITERDMAADNTSNPKSFAAKTVYNIIAWIILALSFIFAAVAVKDLFSGGIEKITEASLACFGAIALPLLFYVIFGTILSAGLRGQVKELKAMFRAFQDALDNNVVIFKEEQDEFVSENIEEINATIEEILANKLEDKEIIEIVTTPRIDASEEFELESFDSAPVQKQEIAATVAETRETVNINAQENVSIIHEEEESPEPDRYAQLLSLVYATDGMVSDKGTSQSDIEQMTELLYRAKMSGNYPATEEQDIFNACIEILNRAYYG